MDKAARQLPLATQRRTFCSLAHSDQGTERSIGKPYNYWIACAGKAR
jgi:hypothetical protein